MLNPVTRLITFIIFFIFSININAQWVKINLPLLPEQDNITRISSLNTHLFLANNGFPYRSFVSNDGGASWNEFTLNETDIIPYITTPSSFVRILNRPFISKDDGDTWERTYGPLPGNPKSIVTINDMILVDTLLFAATNWGLMKAVWNDYRLIWYGNLSAWTYTLQDYDCFSFVQTDNKIFLSTSKGILISNDQGITWQMFAYENISVPYFFEIKTNMIAIINNVLYFSTNGGSSWDEAELNLGNVLNVVVADYKLYALTSEDTKSAVYSLPLNSIFTRMDHKESISINLSLSQNYPNPFNPTTTIKYSIPSTGTRNAVSVQLKIYDMLGREIATLVNEEKVPGNYEVTFDGTGMASGVYFYRLQIYTPQQNGSFNATKKLILIK